MLNRSFLLAAAACLTAGAAQAALVMPSFDGAPAGWVTDRYQPHGFQDVGTVAGRDPVLAIDIHRDEGATARPAAFASAFYNTQGMQHAVSGGAGDSIAAALYIPASWSDGAAGHRRTDLWGVMTDGAVSPTLQYPIIGFTNYGGAARLRVWDADTPSGWVDLATAVAYDAWTELGINFTGTAYEFTVNGAVVYTDNTIGGSNAFSAVIMQAYNFYDTTISGAVATNYTALWSDAGAAEVPVPATVWLLLPLLAAAARTRRPAG